MNQLTETNGPWLNWNLHNSNIKNLLNYSFGPTQLYVCSDCKFIHHDEYFELFKDLTMARKWHDIDKG